MISNVWSGLKQVLMNLSTLQEHQELGHKIYIFYFRGDKKQVLIHLSILPGYKEFCHKIDKYISV
jgi:hypothetical protein